MTLLDSSSRDASCIAGLIRASQVVLWPHRPLEVMQC